MEALINSSYIRKFIVILIGISILLFTANVAFAAMTGYVAEGADKKHYEYDIDALLESYVIHILGHKAPLYEDFAKKQVMAFLDNKKGYIDYENVLEAYAISIITNKSFDVNEYLTSDKAKPAVMPEKVLVVTLSENNKLVYTPKYLDPESAALRLINEATTEKRVREVLTGHAEVFGINLSEYNKLTSYAKNLVAAGVLKARPDEGFTELEEVKEVFDEETEKAKTELAEALEAVNSAADKNKLMEALLKNAKMLDIKTASYKELSSDQQEEVADKLFSKKPFSSVTRLRNAFNEAVAAAMSYIFVSYTDYNLTLKEMVDIQMTVGPQTDSYGGGWQDAKREDVEYYVNPDNFVDPHLGEEEREMVLITTSVLNVRERPTTGSDILTKVYSGQMYVIEDAQEAEPGTASGTEGIWYKITANNVTGWIYSAYTEVTRDSVSSSMFQFLVLSGSSGVSLQDLGNILDGRGILSGKEKYFLEGSLDNNINEIFLVALSLHETGNGRSSLANGIEFPDEDDLFPDQDYVMVYNMFGIGAYDSNPTYLGARYAYRAGWFTPELAILGGAKFTSGNYINHSTYKQDTLYKMRWNPANPGRHQYATDIGWASKQVGRIYTLYDQCTDYILEFDIPRYKK